MDPRVETEVHHRRAGRPSPDCQCAKAVLRGVRVDPERDTEDLAHGRKLRVVCPRVRLSHLGPVLLGRANACAEALMWPVVGHGCEYHVFEMLLAVDLHVVHAKLAEEGLVEPVTTEDLGEAGQEAVPISWGLGEPQAFGLDGS